MLLRILERHGSAAISQYGEAGKTQLMMSFAVCTRDQGLVSVGIFFLSLRKAARETFLSSFVVFVQTLVQFALPERERRCTRAVVCSLGQELQKSEVRWLLCVDSSDSADTAEILGDVAKLAEPECGCLVITSH